MYFVWKDSVRSRGLDVLCECGWLYKNTSNGQCIFKNSKHTRVNI